MSGYRVGVWVWGAVLTCWLVAVVIGLGHGAAGPPTRWYGVIVSNGATIAAITAVLGVVWSWFVQMEQNERHFKEELALKRSKP